MKVFCTNCGANVEGGFCPSCGAHIPPAGAPVAPAPAVSSDIGLRLAACLIDAVPAIVMLVLFGWIPIAGPMLAGLLLTVYWLLRDISGRSLGKLALGLVVVKRDGQPSEIKDRILRNLTLVIGPVLLILPFVGMVLGPAVAGVMGVSELIVLIVKQERLGDMLAATAVFTEVPAARAAAA